MIEGYGMSICLARRKARKTDREVQLGVRVRGVCIREGLQHEIYRCEG